MPGNPLMNDPFPSQDERSEEVVVHKKLLVTGLTGFVGGHLQAHLRSAAPEWHLLLPPEGMDLTRPETLAAWCGQRPDAVIHLAGQTFVPEAFRDPARTLEINLLGTLNLLQALKAGGFTGSFLYVSSGDIYGQVEPEDLPILETQLPAPRNPYAVSKLAAEYLSLQWGISEGWRVMVARPFNHVGSGQKPDFVLPSVARQIARIQRGLQAPRIEVGDVDVTRDFLDVRDVIAAYFALLSSGKSGEIYNVCSGLERSVRDLISQMGTLSGITLELAQDSSRMRRSEQRQVKGSHARLARATGWAPAISMEETLKTILSDWAERVLEE